MHESGDAWYFCGSCGRSFLEKDKLFAHEEDHKNNLIPVVQSYIDNDLKRSVIRPFRLAPSSALIAMVAAAVQKRKTNPENPDSSTSDFVITPKGEYKCRICDKVLANSRSYSQHCLTHQSERPHKCLDCGAEFKAKSYLQNHLKSSHSPLHTFQCPHCSCRFEKDFGLRRHFQMYHDKDHAFMTQNLTGSGDKGNASISPEKDTIKKRVDSTEEVHKKKSAFTVKPKGSLVHREKILLKIKKDVRSGKSKKVNWTIKNKAISGSRPSQVGVTSSSSAYECDVCHKFLSTPMTLKFHKRVHTGEKPYPCSLCDAKFRLSSTRLKHIKVVHAGTGTFQCSHCDSSYKRLGSLRMHIRTLHSDKLEDKVDKVAA